MKIKSTKIISLVLVLFLIISQIGFVVKAVEGDASTGSGSGSHAGSAKNNTIESETAYKNVLGYRFSCIDENTGELIEGTKVIDIYNADWIVSSSKPISSWMVTSGRYNKVQLIKNFDNLSEDDLLTVGTSDWISVDSITFDSALPRPTGSKVKTWIEYNNYSNVKVISSRCGLSSNNFTSSTLITMEPLIQCNVNNARKAWTPSELAAYGAIQYGLTSKGGSNTSGTFGYNLSNYVCMHFPNLLYITSDHGAYLKAATELTAKTTYGKALNGGYGIGIITGDDVGVAIPRLQVSYNTNGGVLESSSAYTLGTDSDGNGNDMICENGSVYYQDWIYNVPNEGGLINDTEFGMYREGYKFVGWAKSKVAFLKIFDPDDETIVPTDLYPDLENGSGEITLYAIWIPTYTVTFKFSGGTYSDGSSSYVNEYVIKNIPSGTQIQLITAEKTGYVLSYWERTIPESTSKYGAESEYTVTCDTTFVAHWTVEPPDGDTCNIIFDINHDGTPVNLFACKSANTQNGITSTLDIENNIVEINGTASESSETLYYFNPLSNAGAYLSGANNLRVLITRKGGSYTGNSVYFCVQAKSGSESYKKHNLLLPSYGAAVLDISLADDGITNPGSIDSLVYSLTVGDSTTSGDWGEWDTESVVFKNYDVDIKIIATSASTSKYDNEVLPIGQMVTKSTVWSGNTMNVSRDGYDFGGWSTNKSTYSEYNKSSIVSSDVILYAIWTEKQADVINVRFDENYRDVTPNLYTVDTFTGQLWNESSYTVKDNGIPKEMKCLWTQYKQDSLHGVRLEVYPYQNRIRMSGTLTEGTLTVPLSTMNITFHDTDWFYLFIAPQGTYALDSNFSEATFYLDVYDESGTKVTLLSRSSDLLKLNRANPNACLINIYQVLDYLDGKSSANLQLVSYIRFTVKPGTEASLQSAQNGSKFDVAITAKMNDIGWLSDTGMEPCTYSKNVPVNTAAGLLQTPIRTGYTFCGWYTDKTYTEKFTESTVVTPNSDGYITVYAKWARIGGESRTVRFISAKYYELYFLDNDSLPDDQALDYNEATGEYKAVKVKGVLYYALKNGEASSYSVDSCLSAEAYINKDGTYRVKVTSRWINDSEYKAVLKKSLDIAKGGEATEKVTYVITPEQREEIKRKAEENFNDIKDKKKENSIFANGTIDIDINVYKKED